MTRVKAAIRAWSMLTPLGNREQTWNALLTGQRLITHTRVERLETKDRATELATRVTADIAKDHNLRDAVLVVGTSKGPIERWLDDQLVDPMGLSQIAYQLAKTFDIRGPRTTSATACSSGLCALIHATMLIESGRAGRVLVVATEASVHPIFLAGFERLGILAREGEGCRPFDVNRKGFIVSEAAAAVLLEASTSSPGIPGEDRGGGLPTPLIDAYAMGCDATHLAAASPDGRVMRSLLQRTGAGDVDLIHAHGTGTIQNDPIELSAIAATAKEKPLIYSHKGALGHTLGAAGLLSIVINCECHTNGRVPGNVATNHPLECPAGRIESAAVSQAFGSSIAMAAGFGGAAAAVRISNST